MSSSGAKLSPTVVAAAVTEEIAGRDLIEADGAGKLPSEKVPDYLRPNDLAASTANSIQPGETDPQAAVDARVTSVGARSFAVPAIITGQHTKGYDRRLCLYNGGPGKLRRYRAKRDAARAGLDLCKISILSDSTEGEAATPFGTNSTPVRLRKMFEAAGYPIAGTGIVLDRNGASGNDNRIGATGTWSVYQNFMATTNVDGSTKTFTGDVPGTIAEVLYNANATGTTADMSVDGSLIETLTMSGGAVTKLWQATGLTDGNHSITVKSNGSTGTGILIVGYCVRRTTGLLVSGFWIGGSTSTQWEQNINYGYANVAKAYGADLYVLPVLTNDVSQSVSAATYKTKMQSIITRLGPTTSDILLVANISRGDALSDTAHRIALYELADENDLPLLDLGDRVGPWASANGFGQMSDNYHMTAKGYAAKAAGYGAVLL